MSYGELSVEHHQQAVLRRQIVAGDGLEKAAICVTAIRFICATNALVIKIDDQGCRLYFVNR